MNSCEFHTRLPNLHISVHSCFVAVFLSFINSVNLHNFDHEFCPVAFKDLILTSIKTWNKDFGNALTMYIFFEVICQPRLVRRKLSVSSVYTGDFAQCSTVKISGKTHFERTEIFARNRWQNYSRWKREENEDLIDQSCIITHEA